MTLPCAMMAAALSIGSAAANVDFSRGKWDTNDWMVVKGPRQGYCHGFTQRDDRIENETPELSPEEVFTKHAGTTYSSMLWKSRLALGVTVSTTTGWDWRMAPLVVIAPSLGVAKDGKTAEFREHWEIVVYDEGINVWHHFWKEGKGASFIKAASLALPAERRFKSNVKHALSVTLHKDRYGRKEMVCSCGGYVLQYVDESLPDSFYAGITGCEGRNFFWDFSVDTKK